MKSVGTEHCKSTSYHPQSNGQIERMNRVLEDMLRHFVNPRQDNWDTLLPVLEFAINNSFQESIQDTPFFLNYGRHPRVPSDIRLPEENPTAHRSAGHGSCHAECKEVHVGCSAEAEALC